MPQMCQSRVLGFMPSSLPVICKAQLWLRTGCKENAARAKGQKILCINSLHRACVMSVRQRLTACLMLATECQKQNISDDPRVLWTSVLLVHVVGQP
jgi:hypothetical protein